jgi:hypothetical protein
MGELEHRIDVALGGTTGYLVPVLVLFLHPQAQRPAADRPRTAAVASWRRRRPGRARSSYGFSASQSPASSFSLRPPQVEPNSSSTEPTGVSV